MAALDMTPPIDVTARRVGASSSESVASLPARPVVEDAAAAAPPSDDAAAAAPYAYAARLAKVAIAREGPSLKSAKVGQIPQGSRVEVLARGFAGETPRLCVRPPRGAVRSLPSGLRGAATRPRRRGAAGLRSAGSRGPSAGLWSVGSRGPSAGSRRRNQPKDAALSPRRGRMFRGRASIGRSRTPAADGAGSPRRWSRTTRTRPSTSSTCPRTRLYGCTCSRTSTPTGSTTSTGSSGTASRRRGSSRCFAAPATCRT